MSKATSSVGDRRATTADRALVVVLRLMGTSSLTAVLFVVAPHDWMRSIHADLGLGPMPEGPVVWYLARSTSAFYAILGGLFWLVSFDLERHRTVILYLGAAVTCLGATLLVVDWAEGLPLFWTVWEGPFVTAIGVAMWSLGRKLPAGAG